jgi:hypothetical protein
MLPHFENPESFGYQILRETCRQVVTTARVVIPEGDSVDRAVRLATNPYLHNMFLLQLRCLRALTVSDQELL